MLAPGDLLGRYRIIRKLGEGGMGAVYLAEHTTLRSHVAIKLLHADYASHPSVVKRFVNEARAAAALRHPNVVTIHDLVEDERDPYIVMEYLRGESLAARIAASTGDAPAKPPLRLDGVISIAYDVCDALAAAHERKIVHRDLKPDNVFLAADPKASGGMRVKVLDFGIARIREEEGGTAGTAAGVKMGTPGYMPPEQLIDASQVDARSDVYALGCVMYAMIASRPPFVGTPAQVDAAHLRDEPRPPSEWGRSVPRELDDLVLAMLRKQREDRPNDMHEVARRLRELGIVRDLPPLVSAGPSTASTVREGSGATVAGERHTGPSRPFWSGRAGRAIAVAASAIAVGTTVALIVPRACERPVVVETPTVDAAPAGPGPMLVSVNVVVREPATSRFAPVIGEEMRAIHDPPSVEVLAESTATSPPRDRHYAATVEMISLAVLETGGDELVTCAVEVSVAHGCPDCKTWDFPPRRASVRVPRHTTGAGDASAECARRAARLAATDVLAVLRGLSPVGRRSIGWVRIEPSSRLLGIPAPIAGHRGFLPSANVHAPSEPYEIQEREVTWRELRLWLGGPVWWNESAPDSAGLPAWGVPWQVARAYCRDLGGDLPSEAEWEHAATPGGHRYPWGDDPMDPEKVTFLREEAGARPRDVKTSPQDRAVWPGGIVHDLMGNGEEWTREVWREPDGRTTAANVWVATRGLPLRRRTSYASEFRAEFGAAHRAKLCTGGPSDGCPPIGDRHRTIAFRCARPL